jgi:hypothetical protein
MGKAGVAAEVVVNFVLPFISALIGWTFWFVRRMKAAAKRRAVNV